MKRRVGFFCVLLILSSAAAFAQEQEKKSLISFNVLGPLFGIYEGNFEMAIDPHFSFFVSPGYVNHDIGLLPTKSGTAGTWSATLLGGINYFPFAPDAPAGFFVGGGAKLGCTGMGSNDLGFSAAPQAQIGYRFIWGNLAFTPNAYAVYAFYLGDTAGHGPSLGNFVNNFYGVLGLDMAIAF